MASADYASFVIFKTRDVCFAGSLVKHQLSMSIAFSISLFISVVQVRFYFKKLLRQQNIPLTSGGFFPDYFESSRMSKPECDWLHQQLI